MWLDEPCVWLCSHQCLGVRSIAYLSTVGSQLFFTSPSMEYTYDRPQVKQRHLKFKLQDDMMFHCVDRQCTGRVSSVGHHS